MKRPGWKMPSTKIDMNHNRIARMNGLDEMAKLLFPGNRTHQRAAVAVLVELKWAEGQMLPALEPIADKYDISRRTLETVRAKMRRMGLIDHISRFGKRHGYRECWVLSRRFEKSLVIWAEGICEFRARRGPGQEAKDRDLERYL